MTVWTPAEVADFGRRLWKKATEDEVLFLASGVAFDILLAGVPFFLLLASALAYAFGTSATDANGAVAGFLRDLFPASAGGEGSVFDPAVRDVVRTRGAAGLFGAVAFVWFSTRLFGSLRLVFNRVFDVPTSRHVLIGKLFDVGLTLASTVLVASWVAVSAYIALARTRGAELLSRAGLPSDVILQPLTYITGRTVSFALLVAIFFALYKLLPNRKVRRQQALLGAVVSAALFEAARIAFAWVLHRYDPATLYTGTLAAVILVVFWVYYAALIMIVGAAASQVWESMRHAQITPTPMPRTR